MRKEGKNQSSIIICADLGMVCALAKIKVSSETRILVCGQGDMYMQGF